MIFINDTNAAPFMINTNHTKDIECLFMVNTNNTNDSESVFIVNKQYKGQWVTVYGQY